MDAGQLGRLANFEHRVAQPLERLAVFTKVSLQGKDPDREGPVAIR
jgi:hypothetical protein